MNESFHVDTLDHYLPKDIFALVIEQQALSHFTSAQGPVRCVVCCETLSCQRRLALIISDYGICINSACLNAFKTLYFEAKALVQDIDEDDLH